MGDGTRFLPDRALPLWRRRVPMWALLLAGTAGLAAGAALAWPDDGPASTGAAVTTTSLGPPTTDGVAGEAPATGGTTQGDLSATTGFSSAVDGAGERRTTIGALVTNEHPTLAAYDVAVVFILLDEDGRTIDSGTETVAYLAPGGTAPVAPVYVGLDPAKAPATVEVNLSATFSRDVGWAGVSFTAFDGIDLQVTDAEVTTGPSGTEVTLTVTNPSDRTTDRGVWSCVLKEGDRIVGGETSPLAAPLAGGGRTTVRVATSVADLRADGALCRAWA